MLFKYSDIFFGLKIKNLRFNSSKKKKDKTAILQTRILKKKCW